MVARTMLTNLDQRSVKIKGIRDAKCVCEAQLCTSLIIMPRAQRPSNGKSRHDPLLTQLDEDEANAKYGHISQPGKRKKSRQNIDEDLSEVLHISLYI